MNAADTTIASPALDALRHDLEKAIDLGGGVAGTRPTAIIPDEVGACAVPKAENGKAFHEVEGYLRNGERMLEIARRRVIELEMRYGQKRRVLVNRLSDDLHRLELEHQANVHEVTVMIHRLEALRHG